MEFEDDNWNLKKRKKKDFNSLKLLLLKISIKNIIIISI